MNDLAGGPHPKVDHGRFTGSSISGEFRLFWRPMIVVVLGMFVGNLPGYTIGIFMGPLSTDFGWSITQIAGWTTASSAGTILAAPAIGWFADRLRPSRIVLLCLGGLAIVCLLLGLRLRSLWIFYAGAFAVGLFGTGTGAMTYGRIIASLFDRGLGTALGLMSAGIGISALVGPRIIQAIIDANGWRWGFGSMSLFAVAVIPLAWLWLRQEPAVIAKNRDLSETGHTLSFAVRAPVFWLLGSGAMLYGLCAGAVPNMIPFLTSNGLTRAQAASSVGLYGVATFFGRLGTGAVIDRIRVHPAHLMCLAFASAALAFALLGFGGTTYILLALPLFGLAVGAEGDCLVYCTAKIFGRRFFSTIFGIVGVVSLYIGVGIGPLFFGGLHQALNGYSAVFYIWSALALIGIPLFTVVARAPFYKAG